MPEVPLNSETQQSGGGELEKTPPTPHETWRSEELLGERSEVLIVHGNEVYRLRRTRQDKLILCK